MSTPPAITSQRQAQDTLYHYMQATLQALPYDVTLDNARYGGNGGGGAAPCDDRIDSENAPMDYADYRDMHTPPGVDYNDLIAKVGDIWKSWGWHVVERDGFDKPNWFGYSPDGYGLNISARPAKFAGYPPRFSGQTPCFPPQAHNDSAYQPRVITRDGFQYDQPSMTPTS